MNEIKYCDNCHVTTAQKFCPLCGNKNLRSATENDYCLLTEIDADECPDLTNLLEYNGIPYSLMPYGTGIESHFALPLSRYRVYVPLNMLENAQTAISAHETQYTDEWKNYLLENTDKLYINEKSARKLVKKYNFINAAELIDFCIKKITTADKIVDGGKISSCTKNGHYLFCNSTNATLTINSATMEIISLKITQ